MKRFFAFLMILTLSLALFACGQEPETSENPTDETEVSNVTESDNLSTDPSNQPSSDPIDLVLRYDDRYTFPDAIEDVETLTVTSRISGSERADAKILRRKSNLYRAEGIACGVGTARVTLKNGQVYNVTVQPAPISVLLILGQSNGEGSTTGEAEVYNKARSQSVLCEEGQIYSTYGWSTAGHATYVAGLGNQNPLMVNTADSFVAKTLTTTSSRSGETLKYPLNSLSPAGIGKTGFDSGLAWSWHEATGDKVWVVNCAAGSTAIEVWQPGEVRYENCVALVAQVRATLEEEIAAGHYELKNYLYFWLQGESNKTTSEEDYRRMFETMHSSLKEDAKLVGEKELEGCGLIMVRAFETTMPSRDTVDNGPRLAQKAAAAATEGVCADVFMACIANDQWITDKGVAQYWDRTYPDGEFPYPLRTEYDFPIRISEVHNGVHYFQPGYNEIGAVSGAAAAEHLSR